MHILNHQLYIEGEELVWLESDNTIGTSKMSFQKQAGYSEGVREGMGLQTNSRARSTTVTKSDLSRQETYSQVG